MVGLLSIVAAMNQACSADAATAGPRGAPAGGSTAQGQGSAPNKGVPSPSGGSGPVAASGATAPVGASDAGGAPVAPPKDQSVTFDWPEATLGAGLPPCQAGSYTGVFEGNYHSAALFGIPTDVVLTGTISFTLDQGMNGEFFEISEGHVDGTADAGILVPFSADIIGTLNCATGQLENAGLVNGAYDVATVLNYFEGPLTGTYDRNTSSFTIGTWSVVEPAAPGSGGSGTWQAAWSP